MEIDISWNEFSSCSLNETMWTRSLAKKKKKAKSYVPTTKAPIRYDVPVGQYNIVKWVWGTSDAWYFLPKRGIFFVFSIWVQFWINHWKGVNRNKSELEVIIHVITLIFLIKVVKLWLQSCNFFFLLPLQSHKTFFLSFLYYDFKVVIPFFYLIKVLKFFKVIFLFYFVLFSIFLKL